MLDPRLDAQEIPGKSLGEHYSEPGMHDPDTGTPRRVRRPLPFLAHPGEEAVSGATLLPQELVSPAPVIVDTRDRDHHLGRLRETSDGLGEEAGTFPPTVHDALLLRWRPLTFPDVLPSEVYDGVYPFQTRGVYHARRRVPADGVFRGRPGATQVDCPVPTPFELGGQSRTYEPRRTTDDNVHPRLPPAAPTTEQTHGSA